MDTGIWGYSLTEECGEAEWNSGLETTVALAEGTTSELRVKPGAKTLLAKPGTDWGARNATQCMALSAVGYDIQWTAGRSWESNFPKDRRIGTSRDLRGLPIWRMNMCTLHVCISLVYCKQYKGTVPPNEVPEPFGESIGSKLESLDIHVKTWINLAYLQHTGTIIRIELPHTQCWLSRPVSKVNLLEIYVYFFVQSGDGMISNWI